MPPIFIPIDYNRQLQPPQILPRPMPGSFLPWLSLHINNIYALHQPPSTSIIDPTSATYKCKYFSLNPSFHGIALQPSPNIRSPSGYTCSANYQIPLSLHINNIYALHQPPSTSIIDPTSANSLFGKTSVSSHLFYLSLIPYLSRATRSHPIIIPSSPS